MTNPAPSSVPDEISYFMAYRAYEPGWFGGTWTANLIRQYPAFLHPSDVFDKMKIAALAEYKSGTTCIAIAFNKL